MTSATRGWRRAEPPKSHVKRRALGRRCLLDYDAGKFPVCDKNGKFDCRGAAAAFARAEQYGYRKIAKKALAVGRRHGCAWAKRHRGGA